MSGAIEAVLSGLATYAVFSTAIGLPLLVIRRRFASPATRAWLCRAALVLPIVVTILVSAVPLTEPVRLAAGASVVELPAQRPPGAGRVRVSRGAQGLDYTVFDRSGRMIGEPAALAPPQNALLTGVVAVWLTGVALMLVRLMRAVRAHRRALAGRIRIERHDLSDAGLSLEGVRLSVAERISGPMVTAGGEICVPLRLFDDIPGEVRRAILAHEIAHVRRRDPAWTIAAEILTVTAWFQPVVWIAARAARRDAELAADDFAVRHADPSALAEGLATVAEWGVLPSLGLAAARDGVELVARIERLFEARREAPARRWVAAAVIVAALALTVTSLPGITVATPDRWEVRLGQGPRILLPR